MAEAYLAGAIFTAAGLGLAHRDWSTLRVFCAWVLCVALWPLVWIGVAAVMLNERQSHEG